MSAPEEGDFEFPEMGSVEGAVVEQPYRPPLRNAVASKDCLTTATGFIVSIRQHERESDMQCMYFVSAGLFVGSVKDEAAPTGWRGRIQNCDLIVGPALWKWAEAMYYFAQKGEQLKRIRCNLVIRNLRYQADLHDGKPVLRSRGVLEQVVYGGFDE